MDLSIIIPVFNDPAGLQVLYPALCEQLSRINATSEILLVDDGSSPPLSAQDYPQAKVVRHTRNKGYGASIKSGIHQALAPLVLILDADNQHDPADIGRFFEAIQHCDLVVGIRRGINQTPYWRRPGKWALRWLFGLLTGTYLPDINCGYRCMRTAIIRKYMHLCSDQFSFSLTSTLLLLSRGYDVQFLDIHVRPRIGHSTVTPRTGFDAIILLIRMIVLTRPLRLFLPASFLALTLGVLWGIPYALHYRGISVAASLLILSGVMIFFFGILADLIAELLKDLKE